MHSFRISRRVRRRFVRGSHEISLVPSLHRVYQCSDIDEDEQSFAIVAEIGTMFLRVSCFQLGWRDPVNMEDEEPLRLELLITTVSCFPSVLGLLDEEKT